MYISQVRLENITVNKCISHLMFDKDFVEFKN